MQTRNVATNTHGRFLYEPRDPARLLVGFHGYAENAEKQMAELQKLPGIEAWSVAAVQALHPFYTRNEFEVVASWMTRQDRELAIQDNLDYIRRVTGSLPRPLTLAFLGFSQGATMAFRAAADFAWRCQGVISMGGDVPPDVAQDHVQLPPVLIARGQRDDWYNTEKFEKDLKYLQRVTEVTSLVFDGGHEWTDDFRNAAGAFLSRLLL